MAVTRETRILAAQSRDEFVGRAHELEKLLSAAEADGDRGLLVSSVPGAGLSELIRQAFDELFRRQQVLPVYFELRQSDETAEGAADRFLHEFLVQSLAFLRSDPDIVSMSPPMSELAELGRPVGAWYSAAIDQLADARNSSTNITSKLNVVARAAAHGLKPFVLIDAAHVALTLRGGERLIEHFNDRSGRYGIAVGVYRRFNEITELPVRMELEPLSVNDAADFTSRRAGKLGVQISDQTRDLIAVQFDRDVSLISSFMNSATGREADLMSFRRFSGLYGRELVSGGIGRNFDDLLDSIVPDRKHKRDLIENLYYGVVRNERLIWEKPGDISVEDFQKADELLDVNEIINVDPGSVFRDYVTARHRTLVENRNPSAVTGEIVTASLKRAPQLMARHYRQAASFGLKDLVADFDCQEIPTALLDYRVFRETYKGLPDSEILASVRNELGKSTLPQIAHVDYTVEFYPPIAQVTDAERTVVGVGFNGRDYADEDEIAWLVAEIESKLEAERDLAEFWCDRLDVVALAANFLNYRIWLIAPEGFNNEALDVLRSRGAIGSSRKQVELLSRYINAGDMVAAGSEADEYEIVVPMGEDTELIAAHAVEEVAKRRNFPPKAINQIKTALVEACINAAEHSLSPDRKIYQKFVVDKNKIVITVSNRGIRMTDRVVTVNEPGTGRRGWGLNLMKGLMDEVKIEQVDDGTRISMTKYL